MINRRELLKLSSSLSFSPLAGRLRDNRFSQRSDQRNILVVVFDAFSASNIPFYGYPRNTTPFLSSILDKAIVYHRHYAAGNYTSPGTASLLTGVYPWTHRVINLRGKVRRPFEDNNLFSLFPDHFRFAHTQNQTANVYLDQFKRDIEQYVIPEKLYLQSFWPGLVFQSDPDTAKLGGRSIFLPDERYGNSLFFKNYLYALNRQKDRALLNAYREEFPRGLPSPRSSYNEYYRIEEVNDWMMATMPAAPQPFLGYVHLLPPHARYRTRQDFIDSFADDGYQLVDKPTHPLGDPFRNQSERYDVSRRYYDEYILYVDAEFRRLFEFLEGNGLLDNTIVVFTSDHGETFERGFTAHGGETLHEPVIRIPLLIFSPDNPGRIDVHTPTSAVDLLPTLLHLSGLPAPEVSEGDVLPPFSQCQLSRSVYALQAQGSNPRDIRRFTAMLVEEAYKLTYYHGYPGLGQGDPLVELYDVVSDPEELENLYRPSDKTGKQLLERLLGKLEQNL